LRSAHDIDRHRPGVAVAHRIRHRPASSGRRYPRDRARAAGHVGTQQWSTAGVILVGVRIADGPVIHRNRHLPRLAVIPIDHASHQS
jgi:hypothetical protein